MLFFNGTKSSFVISISGIKTGNLTNPWDHWGCKICFEEILSVIYVFEIKL